MIQTAELFSSRGTQAIRLPKEFSFPGKSVRLSRTKRGLLVTPAKPAKDDLEERRRRFLALGGSCPDFPDIPRHTTPDSPRDFSE